MSKEESLQSSARLVQGIVVGMLGSALVLAVIAIGRLVPHYSAQVEAQLLSGLPTTTPAEPSVSKTAEPSIVASTPDAAPAPEPTIEEPVEVPATMTIGQPIDKQAGQNEWADLVLQKVAAVIRVPMNLAVEYKPGDLLSLSRDNLALEAWMTDPHGSSCADLAREQAQTGDAAVYIGEERGCRAQGEQLTVVGFVRDNKAVLFAVEYPNLEELDLFEAVVASFRWQ